MPKNVSFLFYYFRNKKHTTQNLFAAKKNNNAPVDMQTAVKTAKIVVNKLAKGEKIDKTWLNIKAKSAILRQYPSGTEWVVAFKNPKIKKKSHQVLYIFLTISGKYVAANYTGQ